MRALLWVLPVVLVVLIGAFLLLEYKQAHGPGSVQVGFCPECESMLIGVLAEGRDIRCAFYDNGEKVGAVLAGVEAAVLTDDETNAAYGKPYERSGLMHNKFCIINHSVVFTGSYNPTDGGEKNRNNVLIVTSEELAKNYAKEFESLSTRSSRGKVRHELWINGTFVQNYFCPEDRCEEHVLSELRKAQESVFFMAYSFTSNPIGNLLAQKAAQGVQVEGVCDAAQNEEFSECKRLSAKTYRGEGLMHHKVFIIDNMTIITGSYNPTASADQRNNENILIITDQVIAQAYLDEYRRVAENTQ